VVGAPSRTSDRTNAGVHVYRGGPDGIAERPTWTLRGEDPYNTFGYSVLGAHNLLYEPSTSGAGERPELVVGAPSFERNATGRVHIFQLEPGEANGELVLAATIEGDVPSFGTALAAPYVGYEHDLVVASVNFDGFRGRVQGFGAWGFDGVPQWTLEGDGQQSYFGRRLSTVADLDDNGVDELWVGAHGTDFGRGAATLIDLGYGGLLTSANTTPGEPMSWFGRAVGAGDYDGDGRPELSAGTATSDEGLVVLFDGAEASWDDSVLLTGPTTFGSALE